MCLYALLSEKNVEELNAIFNGIHTLNYLHPVAERYS